MKTYSLPPTALLTYLYFLQGLPYGLQARFLPIYFRAHGMSLTNISYIKALFFPWMCKTLWAPLVDRHGNKKTWLLWSMWGLGFTSIVAAGIEPSWMLALCAILLIFNLLTSTQDIATDGLAIEILTSSQVAGGNVGQVVGYKLGAIIGGGLLAWLSDLISWSAIFFLLAAVYCSAVAVVTKCVPTETKHQRQFEFTLQVPEPVDFEHHPDPNRETVSNLMLTSKSSMPFHPKGNMSSSEGVHTSVNGVHDNSTAKDMTCGSVNDHSGRMGSSSKTGWIADHFSQVLNTEGTAWILLYVLVYKLGEQGALGMMPMFLIDHGVSAAKIGLWTGVIGQAVSIAGSVLGGVAISSQLLSAPRLLWLLSVLKVAVLLSEWFAVKTWADPGGSLGFGTVPCLTLMLTLLLVSGAVSTSAFTLMMHCSQRADPCCRASHYSLLATAEVLGKLLFSVFVGAITDFFGYQTAFGLFLTLAICVLPLFWYCPVSLGKGSEPCVSDGCDKNS